MRIVFMGTPDFAVPSLDILLENGYTEKNSNEIYHNHLIKDFIGVEKIVSTYLKD